MRYQPQNTETLLRTRGQTAKAEAKLTRYVSQSEGKMFD